MFCLSITFYSYINNYSRLAQFTSFSHPFTRAPTATYIPSQTPRTVCFYHKPPVLTSSHCYNSSRPPHSRHLPFSHFPPNPAFCDFQKCIPFSRISHPQVQVVFLRPTGFLAFMFATVGKPSVCFCPTLLTASKNRIYDSFNFKFHCISFPSTAPHLPPFNSLDMDVGNGPLQLSSPFVLSMAHPSLLHMLTPPSTNGLNHLLSSSTYSTATVDPWVWA